MPSQARNIKHCATQSKILGIYNAEIKTNLFSSTQAWMQSLQNKFNCVFGVSLGIYDRITVCCTQAFWNKELNFNYVSARTQSIWIKSEAAGHYINHFLQHLVYSFLPLLGKSFWQEVLFLAKKVHSTVQYIHVVYNIQATLCVNALNWINQK